MKLLQDLTVSITVMIAALIFMVWVDTKFTEIQKRLSHIKKDAAVIKAALVLKDILPKEKYTEEDE